MRNKKKTEPEKTPEQEELEKRVDAMMDPRQPDNPTAEITPKPAAAKPEPVIQAVASPIADGPTTAPQLPKPDKKITINDASNEPLSIDKLDELAASIVGSKSKKPGKKAKAKAASPKAQDKPPAAGETEEPDQPETGAPELEEAVSEDDIAEQSTELEDPQTDKAVDDIVAYEGDVMLAVADSTAAEHNREFEDSEPREHHVFSTLFWTLVALVAILIAALTALLIMGDSLANKLGL
jgi:hypothetical protein